MSTPRSSWLRRWYGAGPVHLVALTAGGAVGAYAAVRLVPADPVGVAVWVIGGALIHDLVFAPAYSAVDRALRALTARLHPPVPPLNHVRIPALLSGLLLLVWFPLILGFPEPYDSFTGYTTDPYLGRWLTLTAGLFAISAVAYLGRALRVRSRRRQAPGASGAHQRV